MYYIKCSQAEVNLKNRPVESFLAIFVLHVFVNNSVSVKALLISSLRQMYFQCSKTIHRAEIAQFWSSGFFGVFLVVCFIDA